MSESIGLTLPCGLYTWGNTLKMTYVSGIINIFILKIYIRIEFRDNNYIREKSTKLETVCGDVSCNKVAPRDI